MHDSSGRRSAIFWLQILVILGMLMADARTQAFVLRRSFAGSLLLVSPPPVIENTRQVPGLSLCSQPPPLSTSLYYSSKNDDGNACADTNKRFVVAEYNDDAFGLVFLCGSFVAQDVVFSTTFVLSSAIAAIACRQGKVAFNNQVPAVVAGMSFLVSSLLSAIVAISTSSNNVFVLPDWLMSKNESAWQIEVAVCTISILYGFIIYPFLRKNSN